MEIPDNNFAKYCEAYVKLNTIRAITKKYPDKVLDWYLKTIDVIWDEEIKKMQLLQKKSTFVTKF